MKRLIYILLISIVSFNSFGQTIEDLEIDLTSFRNGITYIPKIDKARELLTKDKFNRIAVRYILDYYKETKTDSISLFWNKFINSYPKDAEPLILRVDFLHYESDYRDKIGYNKLKIFYLDSANRVDNNNSNVLFLLSKTYYKDFIYPLEKVNEFIVASDFNKIIDTPLKKANSAIRKSVFEHSADSALRYFYILWQKDVAIRNIIYYPIRQLECYLKRNISSQVPENAELTFQQCYFPSSYFANLQEDWQCDSTVDYLYAAEKSSRSAGWLKVQLQNLNEPCLYNLETGKDSEIIRFTWLRSFHHPISVRVEKNKKDVKIIWKEGKGAGGYSPQGLKKVRKKKLNGKEWDKLSSLFEKTDFKKLQNEYYVPMNDGATWTIERIKQNKYKAHHTNSPGKEIKQLCLYLLNLTKLKIEKSKIY